MCTSAIERLKNFSGGNIIQEFNGQCLSPTKENSIERNVESIEAKIRGLFATVTEVVQSSFGVVSESERDNRWIQLFASTLNTISRRVSWNEAISYNFLVIQNSKIYWLWDTCNSDRVLWQEIFDLLSYRGVLTPYMIWRNHMITGKILWFFLRELKPKHPQVR